MTARPMTMAQPPANPCTNRAIIITTMFGATAHTIDAAVITSTETMSGIRRPR